MALRISECDEAGRELAAYISSKGSDRIDVIVCLAHPFQCIGRGHHADHDLSTKKKENPGANQSMDAIAQRLSAGGLSSKRDQ